MSRTRYEAGLDKRRAVQAAEDSDQVCDSADVRLALMKRVHAGEITLQQAQDELKRIKREGRASGQLTRSDVWIRS